MPMTHYRRMTAQQAVAALDEFLAERPAALQRLRAELAAHGVDPDAMLDGTPASLTPLWQWIADHRSELAADPSANSPVEPREKWPSWARHTVTSARVPSRTMFVLVDGLVSYLAQVIVTGAPNVRWGLGSPGDEKHYLHHHPVLAGRGHQIFAPTLPMAGVLRLKRGQKSLRETELSEYAAASVEALREESGARPQQEDPPVVVVAEPGGFDVGVRRDLADQHSELVDRMTRELAAQDGVAATHRHVLDALLVDAPDWDADMLEQWLDRWLRAHLPFHR